MEAKNIYTLLNIQEHVPDDIVRKAFRAFALKNHPDRFPGDQLRAERFKRVSSAYQDWKLIRTAVHEIKRLRRQAGYGDSRHDGFQPWSFSCYA